MYVYIYIYIYIYVCICMYTHNYVGAGERRLRRPPEEHGQGGRLRRQHQDITK